MARRVTTQCVTACLVVGTVVATISTVAGQTPTGGGDGTSAAPVDFAGKDCLSSGCHASLISPDHVHAPAAMDECQACHTPIDGASHKFQKVSDSPTLCFKCHQDAVLQWRGESKTPRSGHKPETAGKCLVCHNPHASTHMMLLRHGGDKALCMGCHQKDVSLDGEVHQPIQKDGCLDCHREHGSEQANMLTKPAIEQCADCHRATFKELASSPHVHPPVEAKDCLSCHVVHASPNRPLLVDPYSDRPYVSTDRIEALALCFDCHDEELIDEDSADETGFRNGDTNLHYLHVSKLEKGRNCRLCHDAHASSQPKLIRPAIKFGEWEMKLRYTQSKTGGSCGPGCHPAKRYDRDEPVDWDK